MTCLSIFQFLLKVFGSQNLVKILTKKKKRLSLVCIQAVLLIIVESSFKSETSKNKTIVASKKKSFFVIARFLFRPKAFMMAHLLEAGEPLLVV